MEHSILLARAKNNLSYVLSGVDYPAAERLGESAYEDAKRSGNRAMVLFHAVQRAQTLQIMGLFDEAEEILADPLLDDPPAAIQIWKAGVLSGMARWLGHQEEADALEAEAVELAKDIDDPQVLQVLPLIRMETALNQGELETVIDIGLGEMAKDWTSAQGVLELTLLGIAFSGSPERLDEWIEAMQPYLPRFEREVRRVEALRRQAAGQDCFTEIDAGITAIEEEGWLTPSTVAFTSAAAFLPEERAAEYVDLVRATCSEHGWNGFLELVDRYLA